MQICSVHFNTTSFVPTLSLILLFKYYPKILVLCDCHIFLNKFAPQNCKDENTIKMLKFKYMLLYFSTVGLFICLFIITCNNDI